MMIVCFLISFYYLFFNYFYKQIISIDNIFILTVMFMYYISFFSPLHTKMSTPMQQEKYHISSKSANSIIHTSIFTHSVWWTYQLTYIDVTSFVKWSSSWCSLCSSVVSGFVYSDTWFQCSHGINVIYLPFLHFLCYCANQKKKQQQKKIDFWFRTSLSMSSWTFETLYFCLPYCLCFFQTIYFLSKLQWQRRQCLAKRHPRTKQYKL